MGLLRRFLMVQVLTLICAFPQMGLADNPNPPAAPKTGAPPVSGPASGPAPQPTGPGVSIVTQQAVNLGVLS
ncbi:MAG: hypothetical protein ACOZBW_00900, partial [Thermodesulfobacteriota bacterium]